MSRSGFSRSLTDFQIGLLGTAFTIVYAIAGLPLGRMADTGSRKKIMGWGLLGMEWFDCGKRCSDQLLEFFAGTYGGGGR